MSWRAIVEEPFIDSGSGTARFTWVEDVEGQKSHQDVPLEGVKNINQLKNILKQTRANKLESGVEILKILQSLVGQEIDLKEPDPIIPTPKEVYFLERSKLFLFTSLFADDVKLGIVKADDTNWMKKVSDQLAIVISLFDFSYYD